MRILDDADKPSAMRSGKGVAKSRWDCRLTLLNGKVRDARITHITRSLENLSRLLKEA